MMFNKITIEMPEKGQVNHRSITEKLASVIGDEVVVAMADLLQIKAGGAAGIPFKLNIMIHETYSSTRF